MTTAEAEALTERVTTVVRELARAEGDGPEVYAALFGCAISGLRGTGVPEVVVGAMATQCLRAEAATRRERGQA